MWASGVASGGRARAVAAALAVVCALALVACGGDSSSGGQSGSAGADGKPVTLTIWDWDYFPSGLKPFLDKVDGAFEREHPNVTIKHVGIPYPDAPQKFHAAVAARNGPDVMTLFPGAYAAGFKQGLVPLDDRITAQERENWQFLPEAVLPDGSTYVIPYAADGYVMAYNTELFRRAGIAKPPATWDELLETCDKLNAAGIAPLAGGWKDGEHLSDYYIALSDNLLTPAERRQLYAADLPLDSPKLRAALDDFLDLGRHGCFADNSEARTHDDAITSFAAGRAAMILQFISFGPLSEGGLFERQLGADGFDTFPVPPPPGAADEQFMSLGPRTGWAITRWSEQQDLAWEYIQHLMRDESFRQAWETVRLLPNIRSFQPTSDFRPTRRFLEWMKWPANASTYAAYPGDVLDVLVRQAAPLATGAITPDEVLGDMEEQLDRSRDDLKG